jgi:hypothetical protein
MEAKAVAQRSTKERGGRRRERWNASAQIRNEKSKRDLTIQPSLQFTWFWIPLN